MEALTPVTPAKLLGCYQTIPGPWLGRPAQIKRDYIHPDGYSVHVEAIDAIITIGMDGVFAWRAYGNVEWVRKCGLQNIDEVLIHHGFTRMEA